MHQQEETKSNILELAENDERIRGVLLNGSRANPNAEPDKYQDFDITFIVNDFDTFLKNREWISQLGNPFLQQLPDEMNLGRNHDEDRFSFTFLTIFEDGNRIDLTLFPREKFETNFEADSLTIVWLDKDKLFSSVTKSSDKDYYITKPDQQEFSEVCNEFWWTATYVAKGLKRNEIIYAKDVLERVVRPMFLKMIEWKAGYENDFKISIGKSGKFARKFLDESFYNDILKTYTDSNIENNWNALFLLMKIFQQEQNKLAEKLNLYSNTDEAKNSLKYVEDLSYE